MVKFYQDQRTYLDQSCVNIYEPHVASISVMMSFSSSGSWNIFDGVEISVLPSSVKTIERWIKYEGHIYVITD